MNSFIAWIGGKRLLRKAIIERFPEEGFDRYIEVFGGAGWVLFGKEVGKELEVFNDADSNLIARFYQSICFYRVHERLAQCTHKFALQRSFYLFCSHFAPFLC